MQQQDMIMSYLGTPGRMISGSKSAYIQAYPNNKPIFNANILTKSEGKIWFGDLDLVTDEEILQNIANDFEESVYILRELDCRFGAENQPIEELILKATAFFNPKN